jgi:hypothetical protein
LQPVHRPLEPKPEAFYAKYKPAFDSRQTRKLKLKLTLTQTLMQTQMRMLTDEKQCGETFPCCSFSKTET